MDNYFGYPNEQVIYELNTRGKLVINLTNSSYITFTKDEIGTQMYMCENWSDTITREPYKSKMISACGSNKTSFIASIVDKGNFIKSVNGMNNFPNMTFILLDSCETLNQLAFGGMGGTHCIEFRFPKVKVCQPNVFDANKYVKKISLMTNLTCLRYNFASVCPELEEVNMPYQTVIGDGWNITTLFGGCTKLKKLSWPSLVKLNVYCGTYISLSKYIEELNLPKLTSINLSTTALAGMTAMKKANFNSLPMSYVKSRNAWGLPVGCEINCTNGTYTIE